MKKKIQGAAARRRLRLPPDLREALAQYREGHDSEIYSNSYGRACACACAWCETASKYIGERTEATSAASPPQAAP